MIEVWTRPWEQLGKHRVSGFCRRGDISPKGRIGRSLAGRQNCMRLKDRGESKEGYCKKRDSIYKAQTCELLKADS